MGKFKEIAQRDTNVKKSDVAHAIRHKAQYDKSGALIPGPVTCPQCGRPVENHASDCSSNPNIMAPVTLKPDTLEFWEQSDGTHIVSIRHLAHGFRQPHNIGVIFK